MEGINARWEEFEEQDFDGQNELFLATLEEPELMDDEDRTIVRLRFFDGLSLRQISERLNVTYDHVRERYRASMRKLERELGPTMQGDNADD